MQIGQVANVADDYAGEALSVVSEELGDPMGHEMAVQWSLKCGSGLGDAFALRDTEQRGGNDPRTFASGTAWGKYGAEPKLVASHSHLGEVFQIRRSAMGLLPGGKDVS